MKAKLPKKLWLMLVVLYATLRISILNIYKVYLGGGYDRAYGDKIFQWYANTLCDSVRMHRTVNDPYNLKLEPGKPYMVMCNHRSLYDIPLSVAAEGTRSDDSKLGAFKKGGFITAIEAGATIIPVGIQARRRCCPRGNGSSTSTRRFPSISARQSPLPLTTLSRGTTLSRSCGPQ